MDKQAVTSSWLPKKATFDGRTLASAQTEKEHLNFEEHENTNQCKRDKRRVLWYKMSEEIFVCLFIYLFLVLLNIKVLCNKALAVVSDEKK